VEDFSVRVPNHEEDVKRLEQDRSDTEKIASPNVRFMAGRNTKPLRVDIPFLGRGGSETIAHSSKPASHKQ
jgi:hypothetical protein